MATSLNNMIDGWKLRPGYEFLVSVDTYSENVVLVTGFIGSRKYRGALLSLPLNSIKACVSDNVFNCDFSTRNNHSLANMTITNYYSHSKIKQGDVAMFSINKRAKENYVCANCKMKISYFTKKESKSPPSDLPKKSNGSNNSSCDITLLKQTLSYPEISEDNLSPVLMTDQVKKKLVINGPEKNSKSLKRKNQLTNHVVQEKKVKVNVSPPPPPDDNRMSKEINGKILTNNDHVPLSETVVDGGGGGGGEEKQEEKEVQKKSIPTAEITMQSTLPETMKTEVKSEERIDDQETEKQSVAQNYDEYRSMPLSLCTLNHITPNDNDWTSDDSLNRECPKPKKIWMKMIENEDIQKLIDPIPPPTDVIQVEKKPDPHLVNNKFSHASRSYKIKQTLHDKVILTVEKRPEKHKHEDLRSIESISADVYAFSEETESLMMIGGAQSPKINHKCLLTENSFLNSLVEISKDQSTKSNNSLSSSGSQTSSVVLSTKIVVKDTDLIKSSNQENCSQSTPIDQQLGVIKVDLDSTNTKDMRFCKENSLVKSSISTCENSAGIVFNLSDIVWAKITGYPFWPAKIISFTQEDDSFVGCIEWYAWNEISFIKVNSLYHFKTFFSSKYQKRNRSGKYQEAVKLAKLDCGMSDIESKNPSSIKGSDTDSCTSASL